MPKTLEKEAETNTLSSKASLIIERVRRWGGSASDAVLDPACMIFTIPNVDGLIGYRNESRCMIVFGDPICSIHDAPQLAKAFHAYCQSLGKSVVYIAASEEFAKWAIQHVCNASIEFGEELFLDPQHDPRSNKGVHGSLVRRKVRHALKENVTVQEYSLQDPALQKAIEDVGTSWLKNRSGIQIYISHVHLFENTTGKRYFYARHEGKIVGIVLINQLKAHHGWHLNHLMITPEAPNGTPELLVISVLEAIQKEGCHYLTVGAVSSENFGKITGLSSFSERLVRWIFKGARKAFHLDSRKKFWSKFNPHSKRSFLLFSRDHIGLREIWGIIRGLNISV